MNEIVCQFSNREGQVELLWSSGGGFFKPYAIAGVQLGELRESTQQVRKALGEMVFAQNQAGAGPVPWEGDYALAEAGFRLYNYLLPSEDETARKVRRWLEELRKQSGLNALEIVVEERSADPRGFVSIPWNLVYDERPARHKPAFQTGNSTERWRPFWSLRYNLTSGRRVEPLKRMPTWSDPRVIVVVDPDVHEHLRDDQKAQLDAFLAEARLTMLHSLGELEAALEEGYPRLLYWLGHACPDYLQLGPERIAPSDLRNLLRSFDDRERPEGMLAFLNCCQTAEGGQSGSFLDVLHSFGFTGAIATEQQTIDNFANELGLAFLRGFLQEGQPLGELLHGLRLSMAPLALLYGAHCPPNIHVQVAEGGPGAAPPAIRQFSSASGIALRAPGPARMGRAAAQPLALPEQPYRSLGYYDRADRALFTGRDADIVRFAARLDRRETRILILHGESGLGKSSFLRAGVIPYLEEQCVGYRFLRSADEDIVIIAVSQDPIGQIAQALLDVTANPLLFQTPEGEPARVNLRCVVDELLGQAADFATLRDALARDAGFFSTLLSRMAAGLPHALVLVFDQAEELFTLARSPGEIALRDHTLKMLQRVADIKADVKLIVSLRTEYLGRLFDHLRAGRPDLTGVNDDLLRDFSEAALIAAIERPTSETPIGPGQPSPRAKYGFRFADGVAAQIARDGLDLRTEHQDSVLPLIQVICTRLHERKRSQPGSNGVITRDDLEAIRGVEGGLKAFAEEALERSLRLGPSDRAAFKALFTRLYTRQVDGTLTTWLAPRDALEESWSGSVPFAQVLQAAVSVRMLREDALRVEGPEPRPYIRLGHDALARVAAAWQAERDEEERLQQERARVELERKKRRDQIRKLVVGACLALGLALIFGATGLFALYQKTMAVRSKSEAQESLRVACKGLDDLLTEVADVDLAEIPQMESVRRLLLEKARSGYDSLRSRAAAENNPELRWVTARARGRLGDIDAMLGDFEKAEPSYHQAIRLLEELRAESPGFLPYLRDLVRCHIGLSILFKELYRFHDAQTELLATVVLRPPLEATGEPGDRQLLAEIDYQRGVVRALEQELRSSLPLQSSVAGRESEEAYRRAIQAQTGLIQASQGQPGQRTKLARYLNNLGKLLAADHRWDEAEKTFREVIEMVADTERLPGPRWQRARASHNLATLPWLASLETKVPVNTSTVAAALEQVRSARDALERLSEEFPEVARYREELAVVNVFLGRIERGKTAQADLERALGLANELAERFPNVPRYRVLQADACRALAEDLLGRQERDKAESFARESIARLDPLKARYPHVPEYLNVALGRGFYQLARTLAGGIAPARPAAEQVSGYEQARAAARQAILHHEKALESSPASPNYRECLWDDYVYESAILLRLARLEQDVLTRRPQIENAAADAERLPRVWPDSIDSYLQAATFLVKCAQASGDLGRDYFDRAVKVLKQGVDRAAIREAAELDDRTLDALKDRDDFQRLRQSLKPPVAG
jgi:tetratricopeptide (TPR) repeat protein